MSTEKDHENRGHNSHSVKPHNSPATLLTKRPSNFKGYTLEEMRYRRAINALKIGINREKLMMIIDGSKDGTSTFGFSPTFSIENIFKYAQYALFGFTVLRKVRSITSFFRRR